MTNVVRAVVPLKAEGTACKCPGGSAVKRMSETTKPQRTGECHGIALLLTLGILLLLTLLALSFTSSQLTENQAARNFCHSAKAEEIALGGLDVAISVLKKDARENSYDHLLERWAIYYPGSDGFAGNDSEDADLSDYDELEYGVDAGRNLRDVSLRRDPWEDPRPDSRWIKVTFIDQVTGQQRVIGRYAVCIEDENAKVNINTAGNPDPQILSWKQRQNMGVTTAEVDLGAVFDGLGELFLNVFPGPGHYPDNVSQQTALDVVAFRYGWRRLGDSNNVPGDVGDDNSTSQMPPFLRQGENGVDDDGDGLIDEAGEESDEPGEFDPYDPMAVGSPGQLPGDGMLVAGTTGVMGDDTPFLTVSHIKMARSVWRPDVFSISDKEHEAPYPEDRLYRSLLPYITVYSQDLNRFSANEVGRKAAREVVVWMKRENIGRWRFGPSEIRKFLEHIDFPYRGFPDYSGLTRDMALRQIAVNIYDFIDPDWLPTPYGDVVGVEPVAYLNEIEASPPDVPGTVAGLGEGIVVEDYGEYLELWNPYDVPIDVANYYITIKKYGDPQPIRPMAVSSTIIPPRSFFVIGDTLGDVVNVSQQTRLEDQQLRPYPPGCQAYAPIDLDPPYVDIYLEMKVGLGRIPLETHHPIPFAPVQHMTLQKDDPRVSWRWNVAPPTPGRMNAGMSNMDNVYSYFYVPGVRFRSRDPSYDPSDPDLLKHPGGLSSIGELGMVHRANPWQTLNFTGDDLYGYPSDALLLDLLSLPYPYRCAGKTTTKDPLPARECVPGRINIHTAAPEVLLGLNWDPMIDEFKSYYALRVSPALRYDIIQHIIERRKEAPYQSLGDIAADIAHLLVKYQSLKRAPEAAQEAFIRYNANLITTRSNVFKITVLAQAFDRKGKVAASRKLEAIVDRGYSPGTFHRPGEDDPTPLEKATAETPKTLYFRWVTED
jgi:hypothetical protein